MISKQASNADFGDEMFAEMNKVLEQNYAHVTDITKEAAPQPEVKKATALSELTDALVSCAAKLDEVGHPTRARVDSVLKYIETDFLKVRSK